MNVVANDGMNAWARFVWKLTPPSSEGNASERIAALLEKIKYCPDRLQQPEEDQLDRTGLVYVVRKNRGVTPLSHKHPEKELECGQGIDTDTVEDRWYGS